MDNSLITYESALGTVELSIDTVRKYLSHGNNPLTDQEAVMFINLCRYQKLNPFTGEAYAIKFNNDFQMIVGYETYKRRAEENPEYLSRESGIVVERGQQVVCKEGTCLYPTEKLLGGWCRVHRLHNGREVDTYAEVGFDEYNKGQANWRSKPCTMIQKVAVSQALRSAFPADYQGMYTIDEMPASGESSDPSQLPVVGTVTDTPAESSAPVQSVTELPSVITKDQRQSLFAKVHNAFGQENGNLILQGLLVKYGCQTTVDMPISTFNSICQELDMMIADIKETEAEPTPETISEGE